MVGFLIRKFVKNYTDYASSKVRSGVGKLLGYVGIFFNLFLFITKYIVGVLVNSISIRADAINNLTDAGSNIISIVSFYIAEKPADEGHPYGHERTEQITSIFVGIAIAFLGFETAKESIVHIIHPEPIDFKWSAVFVLVISIVVKLYMYFYNARYGKRYNSTLLIANATDSRSDTIGTLGVLVATILSPILHFQLDGYMGLIVSGIILYSAYGLLREVTSSLLGEAPDASMIHDIANEILKCAQVISVHDVLVHSYGPNKIYATAHAQVDGRKNIMEVHGDIDKIERKVKEDMDINLTIHVDPILLDDTQTEMYQTLFDEAIEEAGKGAWTMHDFWIRPRKHRVDVYFDLVVPYEERRNEEELSNAILSEVTIEEPISLFIEIDHPIGLK
ncbi:cation diffusion facilitator family transporter [Dubosiella newyorkensis]|uniref:Cation-efflux pump n=1 Tax=Dubosiella newyorkensis TaxID=1862672 RepID=A0A1U7NPW4_9FIRM|nr:cation diffusion facilitator family transporter [Dubosiella newyorkensis]OLU47677.1 cation-efflux pump [Dubosiella newyorkensis]